VPRPQTEENKDDDEVSVDLNDIGINVQEGIVKKSVKVSAASTGSQH
jgi:hypothetical protein